jgi:hypothetical protein
MAGLDTQHFVTWDTRIILYKILICLDIHKAFWGIHGFVNGITRHQSLI